MLMDQASELRQWVAESSGHRARVVAVTSGKGGVGKTSVAVNLAVRLSQMGRRVVLLDADLGTANADILCNLFPKNTLSNVVAGRSTLADTLVDAPGGFRLVPGVSGLARIAALGEFERARLIQQMSQIERDADVVLVDTGAGIGPNVLGFTACSDQQLVVTTPDPTAMTDAYAVIKTVTRRRDNCDISLLVNMVHSEVDARSAFDRIDGVCRRFLGLQLSYAGYLIHDDRVARSVRCRRPFVLESPHCQASACIGHLAHRLDCRAVEPQDLGLLQRMSNWFV